MDWKADEIAKKGQVLYPQICDLFFSCKWMHGIQEETMFTEKTRKEIGNLSSVMVSVNSFRVPVYFHRSDSLMTTLPLILKGEQSYSVLILHSS